MLQNGTKQVDTVMIPEVVRFGNSKIAYAASGMTIAILIATYDRGDQNQDVERPTTC